MKISTTLALLCCLAPATLAQSKLNGVKAPDLGGYFPPPGGSTALVVGGSDDCANAPTNDAISGYGTFSVTTVGATNGTPDGTCPGAASADVWFYWTATVTGSTEIRTCGGVTADSVITVWDDNAGTCPVTQIACNDDSCGLQSLVTISAVAGTNYFINLRAFGSATTYSGTFTIAAPPPPPVPPVNDDCANPLAINGPGVYPFDNRLATTGTQGQAEALCNFFSSMAIYKDAWWTYTPTASGNVDVDTCTQAGPGSGDTKIAIYDGTGCPVAAAIACNDDACALMTRVSFTAVCGQTYTIQLGNYSSAASLLGTFTVTESGTPCGPPGTPFCFGDDSGTDCPCSTAGGGSVPPGAAGNGCPNSLNAAGANYAATGNPSLANDTISLNGTGMPNASALHFQGTAQQNGGLGSVFGDGLRCAGGTVIRLKTILNVGGASSYPEAGDQSVSVRGAVGAPGVRTYQCWYRNAAAFCTAATFNLTNGLQITWNP